MSEIESPFFRVLVNYYNYNVSNIIVNYDGHKQKMIPTVDGCKQGEILLGYLFNYFMHELIKQCIDLGILERTIFQLLPTAITCFWWQPQKKRWISFLKWLESML